jgi:hypothetical protein
MSDVYRFPDPNVRPTPAPKNTHVATFFRALGRSGRPLMCAAYDVENALELRLAYSDNDDAMRSELFRAVSR